MLRGAGAALLVLGLLLTAFWSYLVWGTAVTEHSDQASLAKSLDREFAHATTPTSSTQPPAAGAHPHPPAAFEWPALADGSAVARLQIPRIGLDQIVVQGTTTDDLMEGPGHYPGTPFPGEHGNVAIAGHRTTYAHPFYDLNELSPGDVILLSVPGHTWRYVTTARMVVSPYDVAVAGPLGEPGGWLTLTTCNPPYSAATRLVVRARLVGPPAAVPAPTSPAAGRTGRTSSLRGVDPDPTHGSGGSWWAVAGWSVLIVALTCVGLFARRFGRGPFLWGALGVLGIVALFGLWELFGAVALKLPAGY